MTVTLHQQSIERVYPIVQPHIRVTPVVEVNGRDFGLGAWPLTIKLELMQHAGSFKTRGAFTHLLTRDVPAAGVVAASGGNHGAAVAYAAMRLGRPAAIFVPTVSSPAKVDRIRSYGASLTVAGDRYADALSASEACAVATGALPIHAFDAVETIVGQGTLALELSRQAPAIDTVLVGVGGGGLIGGIALWYGTSVRIVGVEPIDAPTLTAARAAGRPVDAPTGSVAADSLAPRRVGELMFPLSQQAVERVVLVSDSAILDAQRRLWDGLRIVVEPGGAAAFAALASGAYAPAPGERVAVVVSGGNTTAAF